MCDLEGHLRNKWQSQFIQKQCKNKHRRSRLNRNNIKKNTNSLKQNVQKKENCIIHKRLNTKKIYDTYCNQEIVKNSNISMIHHIIDEYMNNIPIWKCLRCSYINAERLSYCDGCDFCYYSNKIYLKKPSLILEHPTLPIIIKTDLTQKKKKKHNNSNNNNNNNNNNLNNQQNNIWVDLQPNVFQNNNNHKNHDKEIKEENEKNQQKNKEESKENKENSLKLSKLYSNLYLTPDINNINIELILNEMIRFIPEKHKENYQQILINDDKNEEKEEKNDDDNKSHELQQQKLCQVCFLECNDNNNNNNQLISMKTYCNHCMICHNCFEQYLILKIKENDIMPWILCPAENCKAPIDPELILKFILRLNEKNLLILFAKNFIYKHLIRFNKKYWMECPNDGCKFGWNWDEMNQFKKTINLKTILCNNCQTKHNKNIIIKKKEEDHGFNELFKNGTLRKCPKCNFPAMKDHGMCNVMHCGKCGIFWNWRTKQFGTSSAQIKEQARNSGSLWEPGELQFQLDLERKNLPEFIKLLAKNGIKYDPNYRRGT